MAVEAETAAAPSEVQAAAGVEGGSSSDRLFSGKEDAAAEVKAEGRLDTEDRPEAAGGALATEGPYFKTSLCVYWRKGSCRRPDSCRYAHGEDELRQKPDGTWDPSSEQGKAKAAKPKAAVGASISGGKEEVKLCVLNCPLNWQSADINNLLHSLGLSCGAVKKRRGLSNAFLTFDSKASAEPVEQALEGYHVQGEKSRQLHVAPALPRQWERSGLEKSEEEPVSSDDSDKGDEAEPVQPAGREIWEAVTPLANLPYSQQLEQKKGETVRLLRTMVRKTRKCCPRGQPLPEWVASAREHGNLPCEFLGVVPSPQENGYRNKCEFSIGLSAQGERTVGFQLGMYREGVTAIAEPRDCKNVSFVAAEYAAMLQRVVCNSPLPVWDKKTNSGFWRMLTVREGRPERISEGDGGPAIPAEVMLIVQVNPEGVLPADVTAEIERMAAALTSESQAARPSLPLTVMLLQEHTGVSNAAPADCPLRLIPLPTGVASQDPVAKDETMCIHEHLGGLKFQISPTAFFQVNTLAAEKLYALAGDWAELGPDTLLFDVCCGTGTIGLSLAHRVAKVVGIEMNESAVEDARKNARINNITNCDFVAAKAEDVMARLLEEYSAEDAVASDTPEMEGPATKKLRVADVEPAEECCSSTISKPESKPSACKFSNVVAIVDPPRSGLHPTVVRTLRAHAQLRRLVYVSCNGATMVANALELCAPLPEGAAEGGQHRPGRRRGGGHPGVSQAKQRLQGMAFSAPFRPMKAVAVDMFPHTAHCEVVMLFER